MGTVIKKYIAGIILYTIEKFYLSKPYNDKASRLIDKLIIVIGK